MPVPSRREDFLFVYTILKCINDITAGLPQLKPLPFSLPSRLLQGDVVQQDHSAHCLPRSFHSVVDCVCFLL
jgi:hypothetical protein